MRNAPTGSGIWTLGPQLVTVFEEVTEFSGPRTLLEEEGHSEEAMNTYSFNLLFSLRTSCVCDGNGVALTPAPALASVSSLA